MPSSASSTTARACNERSENHGIQTVLHPQGQSRPLVRVCPAGAVLAGGADSADLCGAGLLHRPGGAHQPGHQLSARGLDPGRLPPCLSGRYDRPGLPQFLPVLHHLRGVFHHHLPAGGLSPESAPVCGAQGHQHLFPHHHVLWRRPDAHLLAGVQPQPHQQPAGADPARRGECVEHHSGPYLL